MPMTHYDPKLDKLKSKKKWFEADEPSDDELAYRELEKNNASENSAYRYSSFEDDSDSTDEAFKD